MTNIHDLKTDKLDEPSFRIERRRVTLFFLLSIVLLALVFLWRNREQQLLLKQRKKVTGAEVFERRGGGRGGAYYSYKFVVNGNVYYGKIKVAEIGEFAEGKKMINMQFLVVYDSVRPETSRLITGNKDADYYHLQMKDTAIHFITRPNYEWMKYDSSLMDR